MTDYSKIYRQGDVAFFKISDNPDEVVSADISVIDTSEQKRLIFAHSEATGAVHELNPAQLGAVVAFTKADDKYTMFLKVYDKAEIVHNRPKAIHTSEGGHQAMTLPSGTYRVRKQREYSDGVIKPVVD